MVKQIDFKIYSERLLLKDKLEYDMHTILDVKRRTPTKKLVNRIFDRQFELMLMDTYRPNKFYRVNVDYGTLMVGIGFKGDYMIKHHDILKTKLLQLFWKQLKENINIKYGVKIK